MTWPNPAELKRVKPSLLFKVLVNNCKCTEEYAKELCARARREKLLTTDPITLQALALEAQILAHQISSYRKPIQEIDKQIAEIDHPDLALFSPAPGAGAALTPRIVAAFGTDRSRFKNVDDFAAYTGIAPITRRTGKVKDKKGRTTKKGTVIVVRRTACCKHTRQTFHEFAEHAMQHCEWSRAYYEIQCERGMGHNAAIRN